MAENLMDAVKGQLTPEMAEKAAGSTGESPEGMRKAMHGAVSTVFAGLAHGSTTKTGAERIFGLLGAGGVSAPTGGPAPGGGPREGQGFVSSIFGDRTGAVTGALAESSGIKSGAASHVLSLVAPLVAGVVGKEVVSRHLDAGGMSKMLLGQGKAIAEDKAAPTKLGEALGTGSLSELGGSAMAKGRTAEETAVERRPSPPQPLGQGPEHRRERMGVGMGAGRSRFALPTVLILGALAIWGIFALARGRAPKGVTAPQPTVPSLHVPGLPEAPKVEAPTVPGSNAIVLPGGAVLNVDKSSPEANLARSLADSSEQLPQTFQLDKLTFETGTAALSADADATKSVDDLAAMLKAYPGSRIRVVGHTDSRGNPAANEALSLARANTVRQMMMERGLAADRIETQAKSDAESVADNQTEEGRARNRRVDVVVLSR